MHLGEKILEARKKCGLSRKALSDLTKTKTGQSVSESAIKQYEYGTRAPKFDQLSRIAAALDISIDDLSSEQKPDTQPTPNSGMDALMDAVRAHADAEEAYEADPSTFSTWTAALYRVNDIANEYNIPSEIVGAAMRGEKIARVKHHRANSPTWRSWMKEIKSDTEPPTDE